MRPTSYLTATMGMALLSLAIPASASAQSVEEAVAAGLLQRFETVSGNLVESANRVSEEQYGYRPTEDVRTLGELFTHVTSAHYAYCAAVSGQSVPAGARTPATTKAEIVANLTASRDFCLSAYRSAGTSALAETIPLFGNEDTRAGVLIQNVAHSNLHYGNVVTYMRELGLTPPSSD